MSNTTPVWLLDIDGVLNSGSKPGWHAPPKRRYAYAGGQEFTMRWAPALLDCVRTLIDSQRIEVLWATSWVGETHQIERLMDLPRLECAFTLPANLEPGDQRGAAAELAKRAAALDVVRTGRRLLWTDDDAIWPAGPERDELTAAGALLIEPDERRGLQPRDMEAIAAWLNADGHA